MNQDKLEVVKQEMVRVNIDILGIKELKWTGIGEFNSDAHYTTLYLRTRIPQKKWSGHHGQQKSPKCSTWCNLKNDRMISVRFQGKTFNITVIRVYAPTTNAEEAEFQWSMEKV